MHLRAVIHLFQGLPEDIWVTDESEVAEAWRAELDQEHGITRDEDGEPLSENDHQVVVLNCYRLNIG